jgi:hypothetical protein
VAADIPAQAEFLYKVKPKLPAQFKAAEQNGVPFALILGDVSLAPPADTPLCWPVLAMACRTWIVDLDSF